MSRTRFFVLVGCLLLGIAGSFFLGRLGNPFVAAGYRGLSIPFEEFPTRIGEWEGEDFPLTEKEREIAGMDRYLRRTYRTPDGRTVTLYVAYYGNKTRGLETIYHNATVCFPAAGWEWSSSKERTVTLTDAAKQFQVSLDTFSKTGQEAVVLNFFLVDGEIVEKPVRNKPFWIAKEKFKFSSDPGYFAQLQVVTSGRDGQDDAADVAVEFLELVGRRLFHHF